MSSIIQCRKSDLVQSLLCLNNSPYSMEGREPLAAIYDLEEPDTLLMMGRQYGKSTFIASDSLMNSAVRNFFKTLYVSPRQDQTAEFSNSKLHPFIKHSPKYRKLYINGDCTLNVEKKMFANGSAITLKYAYHTADAVRGISADHLCIDEVQDIILGNIPVIEECLSGSTFQWRTYAGTPKTLNNTLAQKWEQSTQNEWVLKCPHCNAWNCITIESIGPKGLLCKRCRKDLPRTSPGQWISRKMLDPSAGVYLVGFRVPQPLSPVVKWSRIVEKLQTYPVAKFMNEVLALPYDSSGNPLTEKDLKEICCPKENLLETWDKVDLRSDIDGNHLFLAVDWGHGDISIKSKRGETPTGFTVMTLGMFNYDGKFELLGAHKFTGAESDPEYQVNKVCEVATKLRVAGIGVDFGGGFMHNSQLRRRLGTDRIVEWQANDSLRVAAKWIPEASRMLFNRTECMTERFTEIKNKDVKLFNWDQFRQFSTDFLTIVVDFRDDGRSMYYGHVLPDDSFHSYMMCKMTGEYLLRG